MQLAIDKNENGVVSIGESLESRKFQVSVDSQLFMVLSAQIYSDRIMAPIRELCCNAYDSHVAAGTDRKIDVCVPTSSNAIFSVRDYGVGLSKDDVFNLYSSYGKSTKRDSNDQIGCLGLGSKSPLAYTESYSVISFFDGMRYEYIVQLKNGEPYCDLIQESETDEPNGLLVSFFVKSQDVSAFNVKAAKFFRTFHDCVNFTGLNLSSSFRYLNRKYDVAVPASDRRASSYVSYSRDAEGTFVVMGGVAYAFNVGSMPSDPQLRQSWVAARDWLRKFEEIYVYVPIGSVDIAASRETVSPTDKTISAVSAVVNAVADRLNKEYATKYKTAFKAFPTKDSLMAEFNQLNEDLPWIEVCTFKYKDKPRDYDDVFEARWDEFFRKNLGGFLCVSNTREYSEGSRMDTVSQQGELNVRFCAYEVFSSSVKRSRVLAMLFGENYVFVEADNDSRVAGSKRYGVPAVIRHNIVNNYKYICVVSAEVAKNIRNAGFNVVKWVDLEKPPRKERETNREQKSSWETLLAGAFCPDGYWLNSYEAGFAHSFTIGKSTCCASYAVPEGTKKIAYIEAGVGGRYGAVLPIWAGRAMSHSSVNVAVLMKHIVSVVQLHLGIPVIAVSPACARRLDKKGIGVNVFDFYLEKIKELVKAEELITPMIVNAVGRRFTQSDAKLPVLTDELIKCCGNEEVANEIINRLSGDYRRPAGESEFVMRRLDDQSSIAVCYSALTGESAAEKNTDIVEAINRAVEFIDTTYPLAANAIKSGWSTSGTSMTDIVEYIELKNEKRARSNK